MIIANNFLLFSAEHKSILLLQHYALLLAALYLETEILVKVGLSKIVNLWLYLSMIQKFHMDCLQLIFSQTLQMAHDGRKDGRHNRRRVHRIEHPAW